MTIKYHDNYAPPQFGPDYKLTNNWDPDRDYGEEYASVHFRINTRGYAYPTFSFEKEDVAAFRDELRRLLTPLGFATKDPEFSGANMTASRGYEELYLHPHDISGKLKKNAVKQTAEVLATGQTFVLHIVDIYKTYLEMTDAEYEAEMVRRKPALRKYILSSCRTSRVTTMCHADNVARIAADARQICRVGGSSESADKHKYAEYIRNTVIPELIEEGYLVTDKDMRNELLIRTLNKTEQRQKKLYIPES